MKKILLSGVFAALLFSCQNEDSTSGADPGLNARRNCAAEDVLARQLQEDPSLALRMNQIESFTQRAMTEARLVNGRIEIPVVVNVLYKTAAENISLAQIQSQIDILNKDFNAQNTDYNQVPSVFANAKANVGITFVLDQVIRKSTTKIKWGTADAMKKVSKGGLNPTSPTTKLNIWVCTIGNGILGYAQFPGGSSATDGVVIDSRYFGNSASQYAPYNKGRTATHEVGHWLNLRHIWGDTTCGNDLVADTPTHNTANYGTPSFPHYSTCSGNPIEMTMNYMDYTNDLAMYMFTQGQKTRMDAVFLAGGPRNSFAQP